MEPTLRAHRIRAVNAASNKLSSVLVKRRPLDINCCCGVYIVPCQECGLMYIGQAGNKIEVKIFQHKDAVG